MCYSPKNGNFRKFLGNVCTERPEINFYGDTLTAVRDGDDIWVDPKPICERLGLGWSACLVSGSTLLTESVPVDLRTAAQGVSDLVMGVAGAVAGALSGPLMESHGYPWLSILAAGLLVPVGVLGLRATRAGAAVAA